MRTLYIYLLFIMLLVGCNSSFLDRPPLDAISGEFYWKKASDLENYVVQFYPSLPSHGTYAGGYGYHIDDSDDAIVGTPSDEMNGVRGVAAGRWISDWARVRSINIFFDNYSKCEDDIELYRHFLGEAYFFRAWYYFLLVKKYGDVPWYSNELRPDMTEALLKPRISRSIVVDSIIADLDKAHQNLSLRSVVGNNRINKETALAFKSRIALYEGTWQKYHAGTPFGVEEANPDKYFQYCIDAAEELMNGTYQTGVYEDYYKMFGLDDMSSVNEVLFYKAYNQADGLSNDMQFATSLYPVEIGATWSLVSSYLDKNGNPYNYMELATHTKGNDFLNQIKQDVDERFHHTIWCPGDLQASVNEVRFDVPPIDQLGLSLNPTGFQVKKGSNPYSSGAGKGGGGNSETGFIYFRFGEVLLNYAEALYELKNIVAYDALNTLRKRVNMPDFKVMPKTSDPNITDYGYSITDALYEIRRERRVELALEGHRVDDYRRWAAHALFKGGRPKGYPFNSKEFPDYSPNIDENGLVDYFQTRLPNGYGFRDNQDYLNSIPLEELTINPNLVQNPNW